MRCANEALIGLCVMGSAACGTARSITVVNDVTVSFDVPTDRLPVDPANARLAAAAREVRELLGHPLSISLDVSLVPEYRDGFDSVLTSAFEQLATALERAQKNEELTWRWARQKLARIVVRYAPSASREELEPRWDASGAVLVTVNARAHTLIPVADIFSLLRESAEKEQAREFAKGDPESVPAPVRPKIWKACASFALPCKSAPAEETKTLSQSRSPRAIANLNALVSKSSSASQITPRFS